MKRRDFIRLSLIASSALLFPTQTKATTIDSDTIDFSSEIYTQNSAQTIMIFLYGGASQLAGNLTNLSTIEENSQSSYNDYFRGLTTTQNGCWQEAGGVAMESLLQNGDMTLFRTCYSQVREEENNKAHGVCTAQNQHGSFDESAGGIVTNLAKILNANEIVDENSIMPFITMEGESYFYSEDNIPTPSFLKPVGMNESFNNPYARYIRDWRYYTQEEREIEGYNDREDGFDPALDAKMDTLAQSKNHFPKIKDAFAQRAQLSQFIDNISTVETPDLGEDAYQNNSFAKKIEASVKLLVHNPDTKVITLGTGGLGGWDDHNDAREYVSRMERLFGALKSAMAHLKAENKIETINIMVFGEFGRNVNLNSANGWDHGNLQNLYVLGGKRYFNHQGVVGETRVDVTGSLNRLWLKPKSDSYWFEPLSIAATLYKIYGIENPEILTQGYPEISPLFS